MTVCAGAAWVLAGPAAVLASVAWLLLSQDLPPAPPWETALTTACAGLLGLWGSYWTLACLAVAVAHTLGSPAKRRLPRRAILAVSLTLGLSVGFSAAAQASGAHAEPASTVQPISQAQPLGSDSRVTPQWSITARPPAESAPSDAAPYGAAPSDSGSGAPGYSASGTGPALPPIWGGGPRTSNDVVVRQGDSLWSIAQRRLGPDATAADIDREWRLWYRHNHAVIGPDPDLIHPGQLLRAPD
ncbi:hypothetical protein DWQ67_02075 [Galactobacter caseinivorans]|uniref:LysM domain-containing protein n=1 Tax=Galactobacter caseinivorans TaxID=2676123 RepID=A0A496PM75_9MICC|nr:hypothetical protein DWQ67_02075 [Galactobacter caseinivorans]